MIKNIFILLLFFLYASSGTAQEKFTVSGFVKDAGNGEDLIGATVYLKETMQGTITNTYGFYSITVPKGTYQLMVSFIGYEDFSRLIVLEKNQKLNVSLEGNLITTEEVVIVGERADKNVENTEVATFEMPVEKIKSLPVLFGEVDVLKTIQLTPGVQAAGEGNSGFYVRGGGPDQNLILLDEAVVYNASHLFGFFSVFNADALKNIEMIKGGMPANYGGRLASVLNLSMKEGNKKNYEAEGGIGIISSRLTVQGPIKKDTSSFIVSGRRTYIDILMQPFLRKDSPFKGSGYFFYDLNAKANYTLSQNDRLYVSGYFGRDIFSITSKESDFSNSTAWGNGTLTARWNHLFGDKLFSNTTLIYSDYNFELGLRQSAQEFKIYSGIRDYSGKVDFTFLPSVLQTVKFGVSYIHHTFTPTTATASTGGVELDLGDAVKLYGDEAAVYINDNIDISERLKVNAGLRLSGFQQVGPFERFVLNDSGDVKQSILYDNRELVKRYLGVEPRFSLRYKLDKTSSLKASVTRNFQYMHLAALMSGSLPTDVWVPSSDLVRPMIGWQYSLGYYRNFKANMFETYLECYYKEMDNLIEYKEDALPEDNAGNNTDNNLTFGSGTSYGGEVFLKKQLGSTTGWIGYTLSWTDRLFPNLNGGVAFPAKYDRRHDISFILTHEFSDRISASMIWVYATGNTMTIPVSRAIIGSNIVNQYSSRNGYRMAPYHRLDLSVTLNGRPNRRFRDSWNFSVYNAYNRYNPYYIYFDVVGNLDEFNIQVKAKQVSLFPMLPSITWNFRF